MYAPPTEYTKVCRGPCGAEQPLHAFFKHTRSLEGRQAWCRTCTRGALDQADARRPRRPRPLPRPAVAGGDFDALEALFADCAPTVVDVLYQAAADGAADVLDRLARALCPHCAALAA